MSTTSGSRQPVDENGSYYHPHSASTDSSEQQYYHRDARLLSSSTIGSEAIEYGSMTAYDHRPAMALSAAPLGYTARPSSIYDDSDSLARGLRSPKRAHAELVPRRLSQVEDQLCEYCPCYFQDPHHAESLFVPSFQVDVSAFLLFALWSQAVSKSRPSSA